MSSWAWPSCKQPKTQSFRANGEDIFKTANSVFCDTVTTPESWFTNSSDYSTSFSSVSEEDSGAELVESVIRGVRSDRLFVEPGGESNSILEESKSGQGGNGVLFEESVVLALESDDPYVDFRTSMEEMVEAHGLKNWECLEELLCWYLRVNGKKNHGFIVGAFVDLLVALAVSPKSSSSSSSSPSLSSLPSVDDEDLKGKISSLQI
ncbi:hypothetical protein Sjap_012460 [Stephania japonica]|uniref:Transcription repressor n=1 Tax=Stephania japonica TaxID=461633 RepID=A0AAP0NXM6_9MAGN